MSQTSGTANSSVTPIVATAKARVFPITCPVNGSVNTSAKLANVSGRAWPGSPVRRLMMSTASVGMPMSSARTARTPTLKRPPLVGAPRRRPIGIPATRVSATMLTCPSPPCRASIDGPASQPGRCQQRPYTGSGQSCGLDGHGRARDPPLRLAPLAMLAEPHHAAVLLGEIVKLLGPELRVERYGLFALGVAVGSRALDEHGGLALGLLPESLRLGREQKH